VIDHHRPELIGDRDPERGSQKCTGWSSGLEEEQRGEDDQAAGDQAHDGGAGAGEPEQIGDGTAGGRCGGE
jgi:hypothetical protein